MLAPFATDDTTGVLGEWLVVFSAFMCTIFQPFIYVAIMQNS